MTPRYSVPMKTTITVKESGALPSGAVRVTHATVMATPEASLPPAPESVEGLHTPSAKSNESFRELLHQRYTAPFVSESPYPRGGINE
jgi:hypothetical protein